MATSGSFITDRISTGSPNDGTYYERHLIFQWSIAEQDITSNSTKINWSVKGGGSGADGYLMCGPVKVVINGVTVYEDTKTRFGLRVGTEVASGTATIAHDSTGEISFSASVEAAIYNYAVNSRGSGTWELPTIARASVISSVADVTLGDFFSIKWTPMHGDFVYRVRYSIGVWEYSTLVAPGTTAPYTFSCRPSNYMDIAQFIPNSKTGTMKAELFTYSDSAGKNQVGEISSKTFTVTVPSSAAPRIAMDLTPVSSLTGSVTSYYVQRLSKVKADFSRSTGQYGATIKSFEMVVNGSRYTASPYQSDWLPRSGYIDVKGIVTDSRGYSSETTQQILVIPYDSPAVVPFTGENNIVCARCLADGTINPSGTYLKIRAGRKYSKVTGGGTQRNFCMLGYRYGLSGTALPSTFTTLISKTTTSDDIDIVVPGVTLEAASSYTVQLHVQDDFGAASTLTFAISTDQVVFHLRKSSKGGAAFGKYSEADELLDVAWDANFRKSFNGCYLKRISVEGGTTMRIQTMWTAFDGGATRQTIYIFGSVSGTPVHGMITVNRDGVASWSGTGNVTVSAVTGGAVEVKFPAVAWDVFTAFSAKFIEIA